MKSPLLAGIFALNKFSLYCMPRETSSFAAPLYRFQRYNLTPVCNLSHSCIFLLNNRYEKMHTLYTLYAGHFMLGQQFFPKR
jgi:hypothetical protein